MRRQDVIEGVNLDAENMISLHTDGDGCSAPSNPDATGALVGSVKSPDSGVREHRGRRTGFSCASWLTHGIRRTCSTECAVQGGNAGCSYRAGKASYGQEFNAGGKSSSFSSYLGASKKSLTTSRACLGGGVIATLFTEDEISIWFFPRAEIPDNISQGAPDRSTWGPPTATWTSSSCDIARMFSAQ